MVGYHVYPAVLRFGLIGGVPLAAQDPHPYSGVILKIGTHISGIFLKKVPLFAILPQKHTKFSQFPRFTKRTPENFENHTHEKWDPYV